MNKKLGCIKNQIKEWSDDILIGVKDLKEILGRCGYYLPEKQIRKLSREGKLEGRKFSSMWFYPKSTLYKWIRYLEKTGLEILIRKEIRAS